MTNILKKISALFAGFVLIISGAFNSVETVEAKEGSKKALIVYFSHTGNTKLIAEKAQKELAAANWQVDLQHIEPQKAYPEYGDELRDLAKEEANDDNCRPEFKKISVDAQSYDVIFVGTPVWWYKAPKIVLSFLEKQDFSGKEVRFFITHGGGPGTCVSDMKTACKGANFGENIDVYGNYPGNGEIDYDKVAPWIKKINENQ
ncbi:MAG: NAD(P)H-dependent oxidoreductase [Alphaproteobacteria bacterium]|nr:NAD(P)H-dependent oxidoreductase [Alphaproteobacteria bacterium]